MASPFTVFRRNLRPLLVALTLLAIFAFVALPSLEMYLQQNQRGGMTDATLATWNGGTFRQSQVTYQMRTHGQTLRFLEMVAEETIARGGTPRVPGFAHDPRSGRIVQLGITHDNSPETAIRRHLFAHHAQELGLELDDATVELWLNRYTDGKLSSNEIAGFLATASDNLLGRYQLHEHLKAELLAGLVQRLAFAGLASGNQLLSPPTESWQHFLRVNQQAVVTAFPVLVQEYLDQVDPTPSAAELTATYEAGKERFPNPNESEPGFRRRYSADIEYLAASLESFIDRYRQELSEEELRAEYQRRLEGGSYAMPPQGADREPPAEAFEFDLDAALRGARPGATEPDQPAEPAETDPPAEEALPAEAPVEVPAELQEAPATEPAESAPPPLQPADDAPRFPEDSATAEEAAPLEDAPAPGEEDQSRAPRRDGAVRLVAAAGVPDQPPAEEAPTEETPDDLQPADAPRTEQPIDPQPVDPEPVDADPADPEPADVDPADVEPADVEPADVEPTVRPFEEVRDEIARDLALPAARRARESAVTGAFARMRSYFNDLAIHRDRIAHGAAARAEPERPSLRELATEFQLEYVSLSGQTMLTIQEDPIARSATPGEMFQRGEAFAAAMFTPQRPQFHPLRTIDDSTGTTFISWKTESREPYVPTLEEVHDEVVEAVQWQRARELAQQAAEELAERANAAPETPLVELIPETQRNLVFEAVGPFSWMQSFGPGMMPFVSTVPELDNVGERFMRQVFTQPIEQYRVAPNQPESVYYVVQTTDLRPEQEDLRQRFLQVNQRQVTESMAMLNVRELYDGWMASFEELYGVEWAEPDAADARQF